MLIDDDNLENCDQDQIPERGSVWGEWHLLSVDYGDLTPGSFTSPDFASVVGSTTSRVSFSSGQSATGRLPSITEVPRRAFAGPRQMVPIFRHDQFPELAPEPEGTDADR